MRIAIIVLLLACCAMARSEVVTDSTKRKVPVDTTSMTSRTHMLQEVEVVAMAPPVTQKGDTTAYNASSFKVAEGSALEDLIKKLPGAELDEDGTLTINGEKITKLMVDGKEFFISDLNTAMKDLPADMIKKLKVYHRKSDKSRRTGVNDGKEDFVLDLNVKPEMKTGWNGNITAGYGNSGHYRSRTNTNRFTDKENISIMASAGNKGISSNQRTGASYNRRGDKLSIYADVNYRHSWRKSWNKLDREEFISDSASQYTNSYNESRNNANNLSSSVRLEWTPDTMTYLSFSPSVNYQRSRAASSGFSETKDNEHQPINRKENATPSRNKQFSSNGSFAFYRRLGKPGRSISVEMNYQLSSNDRDGNPWSETHYYNYSDSVKRQNLWNNTQNNNSTLSVNIGYTEPVFKNHYARISYAYDYRPSTNEKYAYQYDDETGNYMSTPDSLYSNCLQTTYNIHTASVNFIANTEKYDYTLGLDVEAEQYKSHTYFQESTIARQHRNVVNFAPNLFARYKFSDRNTLTFYYNGRTNQPSIDDLQPVTDITDPLNIRTGNPNLKASYNSNISMNYNCFFQKTMASLNANLWVSNTLNSTVWAVNYNPKTGVRTSMPLNVNGNWNLRSSVTYSTPLDAQRHFYIDNSTQYSFRRGVGFTSVDGNSVKNYTLQNNITEKVRGMYRTEKVNASVAAEMRYGNSTHSMTHESDRETFDYLFSADADVNLPWDFEINTGINCRIKNGYGEQNDKTRTMWNAQLSKMLFKRRLILRLTLYDLLHQNESIGQNVNETSVTNWSSSVSNEYAMFSVTYKFNTMGGRQGRGRRHQ